MFLSALRTKIVRPLFLTVGFGSFPAYGASLVWQAPASCPSNESVTAQVSREIGAELESLPKLQFHAQVYSNEGGYELVLRVRGIGTTLGDGESSERRIRTKTCDGAVDALSAAMALALHSLDEETRESPPKTLNLDSSEPSEGTRDAQEPSVRNPPSAPPLPLAKRAVSSSGTADNQARPPNVKPYANLGVLFDVGTLPDLAFGATATIGIEVSGLSLGTRGLILPTQRATVADNAQVEFQLLAAGLVLCGPAWGSAVKLQVCAGGDYGKIRGSGAVGVKNPRSGSANWVATSTEVRGLWSPNGRNLSAYLSAGVSLPLLRESFVLDDVPGSVHRSAVLCLRLSAGLEFNSF